MKKNLLLLFGTLVFIISCSTDSTVEETILGTWKLTARYENNIDESDECLRRTTITFNENGEVSGDNYMSDINNDCVKGDDIIGNWEKTNIGYNLFLIDEFNAINKSMATIERNMLTIVISDTVYITASK